MKLNGKVAIVTGGARGIGIAIARALGKEGAKVAIGSRTAKEVAGAKAALEAEGIDVFARPLDITKADDAKAFVDEVVARFGTVDVLVNNAGVGGAIGLLEECDLEEWHRTIEINVFGTMHMCRAVLPIMRKKKSGKIVNLAGGGVGGPAVATRLSAYTTSKAATVQLTEALAKEVADANIQVNVISPGAVVTEMTAAFVAAGPEKAGKELYERTLQQRQSGGESPEIAARMVVWLASDASTLTGKMLSAKWDKPEEIDQRAANASSLYALRRIDQALFAEVPRK